jgi:hypothetical protein
LFRAAHVLHTGSYWFALLEATRQVVSQHLHVSHHIVVGTPESDAVSADLRFSSLFPHTP